MKLKTGQTLLYGVGLLVILACGGSGGSGLPTANSGSAFFEDFGSGLRMRGKLAFVDNVGAPVSGPPEGTIVLVGAGTRAGGADPQGAFIVNGLPDGIDLRVRCFARGYLPLDYIVPAGSTSTDQLTLQFDLNQGDNPTIQNVQFDVADDGILRFQAVIPSGTLLSAFHSPTLNPNMLGGASGDLLNTQIQQMGNQAMVTGIIGDSMPTGSLYMLVAGANGITDARYGTCQLTMTDYRRAGRLVNGNIHGPGGVACVGAEVLAFEQGQTANRGSSTAQAEGRFGSSLNETPTGNVSILVQWTDPATNIIYVCLFKDNL